MKPNNIFISGLLFGVALFFWLLPSAIAKPLLYVEDEVLIVPKMNASAATARGMATIRSYAMGSKGKFIIAKIEPGQSVDQAVKQFSGLAWVESVQPNYVYTPAVVPNDPDFNQYWGLLNTGQSVLGRVGTAGADIDAPLAWNSSTNCSSVPVAVIDTGVDYNHPDLSANIWMNTAEIAGNSIDDDGNGFVDDVRGWDFAQGDNDPMDVDSHGTHVAGTIGAVGNNGIGGTGVCWQASLMPLRAADGSGLFFTSRLIAAIDYAIANGARVINMSLSGSSGNTGDLLYQSIGRANAAGVLVVAAAGNETSNNDVTPVYPASYAQPNIIVVAASDSNDQLATFSNFGSASVDVAAPGTIVLSTLPARQTIASEGFEVGAPGWLFETLQTPGNTMVANSVAITNEQAFSGNFSLTDSPGGGYTNNRSYRAISPVYNLSGLNGNLLNFWINLDTFDAGDLLDIEGSTDGVSWMFLSHSLFSNFGSTGGWVPVFVDLSPLDGAALAQVRFRLDTDGANVSDGFHMDDLSFSAASVFTGNEYAYYSGTSMATPHVSGLAALILSLEPALTASALRSRILDNADSVPGLAGSINGGKRLNAARAMPLDTSTAPTASSGGGGCLIDSSQFPMLGFLVLWLGLMAGAVRYFSRS